MSNTRTGSFRSNSPTYDEIHVLHAPEGANVYRLEAATSGARIIRRVPGEASLTIEQIAEAVRTLEIPSALTAPWTVRDRRVTAANGPRRVKVIFVSSPVDEIDWTNLLRTYGALDDYFASYALIVPRLEMVLPKTWTWFSDKISRADPVPQSAADALRQKLAIIIKRLAFEHGAIRGTGDRFSVESLSLSFGLKKRSFERHVQARAGVSAADLIRDIRLDLARELLRSSPTVIEVANRVGYTPSHFAKLYHARFDILPADELTCNGPNRR